MKKIEAKIVADSISPQGHRITSMLLTYPRFIHGEIMTHRMFSRNSASSRAIPFEKMVKMVEEDPFIPIAWQKDHKGMQGNDYIKTEDGLYVVTKYWLEARDKAVKAAKDLHSCNITKQLCNRLLEPYMWHTTLVTATEFENFFELRAPKYKFGNKIYHSKRDWYNDPILTSDHGFDGDAFPHEDNMWWYSINESSAEIHIQALAESMWDAMNESTPKQLQAGEWHLPFSRFIEDLPLDTKIKVSVARAARLSYMTFEGNIDYTADLKLHDRLLQSGHYSPFEHVARAMSDEEYDSFYKGKLALDLPYSKSYPEIIGTEDSDGHGWCNNFRGWIQYRYLIEK